MLNKNKLIVVSMGIALGGIVFFGSILDSRRDNISKKNKSISVKKTQPPQIVCPKPLPRFWQVQSIDTMKYSRDHADLHMKDEHFMTEVISNQVADIAKAGATHIAIDTPYDEQFLPMLNRWVTVARQNKLKVFFRGNWSSWEGWFNYPKNLTRQEHIKKTKEFILKHPNLFAEGDIFSACPECENGGPGDPRQTKDVSGHRKFLIDEYNIINQAFQKINKKVDTANFSMNGDVANLIMDKTTTQALGNVVTIDHYVKTPEKLANDVKQYVKKSGGKVFVAELGAPAGHIHKNMSEEEQAQWIERAFRLLSRNKDIRGINYWVNMKGSTAIWNADGTPRKAVGVLTKYYRPNVIYGKILDKKGFPIVNAKITYENQQTATNRSGCFDLRFITKINEPSIPNKKNARKILISHPNFREMVIFDKVPFQKMDIILEKKD